MVYIKYEAINSSTIGNIIANSGSITPPKDSFCNKNMIPQVDKDKKTDIETNLAVLKNLLLASVKIYINIITGMIKNGIIVEMIILLNNYQW